MHADDDALPSTQPYLLRALHEWCTDNGFTPYLAVQVDGSVQVPPEFVRDGQIVLNLSYDATDKLQMGNEYIEFQARFGGVARQIIIPVHRVLAIYARENNQGMAFTVSDSYLAPAPAESASSKPTLVPSAAPAPEGDEPPDGNSPAPASKRPALRLVK